MAQAADHQATQAGLVEAIRPVVGEAWGSLDTGNLRRSLPTFVDHVRAIVHRYGPASAALSTRFYRTQRREAGIRGSITVRHAPLPDDRQVDRTVRWATGPLWSADPAYASDNLEAARSNVLGAVDKLILDVGRDTVLGAVQNDRKARGWARVPEGGSCAFCALLATRGAVYRTEQRADFRSHDHCRCVAEPIFVEYEPSARVRELQALYRQATAGVSGGKAMRAAFRRALAASEQSAPGAPS